MIALFVGVVSALVWYQVADKRALAAEKQSQIVTVIEKSRGAISETVKISGRFADEIDAFAARAISECQSTTDKLKEMIPEDQAALLKPGPNAENGGAKVDAAMAKVVITMNELWDRAYSCQTCAIRIRHAVREIQRKGEEGLGLKAETREDMEKLVDLSRTLVDMFEKVKVSEDVETVRKGFSYIKPKGGRIVDETYKRLRREHLEKARIEKTESAAKGVSRRETLDPVPLIFGPKKRIMSQ